MAVAIALGATAITSTAAAQTTGRIDGLVLDATGAPLPGADVTATSPTQIGGAKRATSDDGGGFRFVGLTPGTFAIRAAKSGFVADERDGVFVGVNGTVELTFVLEPEKAAPSPGKEVYTVKAQRPVVDTHRAGLGEDIPGDFAQRVPILTHRPQQIVNMTAGVNPNIDNPGNPSINGGSFFNNSYTVDGAETTDPTSHTFGTNFNFDAVADMQVQTAGLGAENGMVTGGVTNIVTRSGSNAFQTDASVYYQADALALKREHENAPFSELNANLNLSGPLVRDRLWYFSSVQFDDRTRSISCPSTELSGLCPHPEQQFLGVEYLLKLNAQLTANQRLIAWTQGAPASIDNLLQDKRVSREAEAHQNQGLQLYSLAWEYVPSPLLFVKAQATYHRITLDVTPQSGDLSTPGFDPDKSTSISSGNYTSIFHDTRNRVSGDVSATMFLDRLPLPMEPRFGVKTWYAWNPQTTSVPGNTVFLNDNGALSSRRQYCVDFNGALPRDDPNRCITGALTTETKGTFETAFVQDTLKPSRRIRITPGLGLHHGVTKNYADTTITDFTEVTPHVNATWDPFGDGRTVVRAGYNQYVDIGFLEIPGFIGRQLYTEQCDDDPNTRQVDFVRNCSRGGGIGGTIVDKNLRAPRVHEALFGAEHEVADGFSVGGEFVYRDYVHQWEDRETNLIWNADGSNVTATRDPTKPGQFIFRLETPNEAHHRYIGFSLTGRKFTGRWNFLGSYTWSRSEGTADGSSFATSFLDGAPGQQRYWDSFLPDDRRHVIKIAAGYQVTPNLDVGLNYLYETGTPYSKWYFNDFYRTYTNLRARRGYDPKDPNDPNDDVELRLPDLTEIGIKAVYNLKALTKQNFELIGEVFNLLNTATWTKVQDHNVAADAPIPFGAPTDKQSPLRVRLGLRYRY